jgi:hypothetical protein
MNESHGKEPAKAVDPARISPSVGDETNPTAKQPFVKPKLTFVRPKIVKHGSITELTGFFGAFSP